MRTRPTAGALGRWLAVVLWASVIFLFSTDRFSHERTTGFFLPLLGWLFPGARPADLRAIHAVLRKLAHFSEYLVLGVLLYRALPVGRGGALGRAGLALALAAAYAVTDELHQGFVPGRTPSATDFLIDVSGAAAGQVLVLGRRG